MASNGRAPTFLDLLPGGEKVAIPGGEVEVLGVSIGGIGFIARQFPEVIDHLLTSGNVDGAAMVSLIPKAVPLIIAAGLGHEEDKAVQAWAAKQPLGTQIDLVSAVIRRTAGADDFRPLVEKLKGLLRLAGLESLIQNLESSSPEVQSSSSQEKTAA